MRGCLRKHADIDQHQQLNQMSTALAFTGDIQQQQASSHASAAVCPFATPLLLRKHDCALMVAISSLASQPDISAHHSAHPNLLQSALLLLIYREQYHNNAKLAQHASRPVWQIKPQSCKLCYFLSTGP
jgi:hypothetical protein